MALQSLYLSQSIFVCLFLFSLMPSRRGSETSRQVHLPWKQCLIYWDRYQHATSKGMDSYRLSIGHMEVRPGR